MRIFRHSVLLLALSVSLGSCLSTDDPLTGYGDAYIIVETSGQDTLKGLGLHAFSYAEFSEVTAVAPGSAAVPYTLQAYLGYKQDFILETPRGEFTKMLPLTGTYLFSAKFTDGQLLNFSNELYTDVILPTVIKTAVYNITGQRVDVTWGSVLRANSFNVKLIDSEGKTLFLSPELNNSVTEISIARDTQGWQTADLPAQGNTLTVEVAAYLKEKNSSMNRLQCISRARTTVVWGQ